MSVCYKGCSERPPIVVLFLSFLCFSYGCFESAMLRKTNTEALLQERLQYIGFLNELRAVVQF